MRIRDPGLLRLLHFEWDECALCGTTHRLHLHHILFRSHGGDDVRANLAMLCLDCHQGYHTARSEPNYRLKLAEHLNDQRPDTIAYLVDKLGEHGMERWFTVHSFG